MGSDKVRAYGRAVAAGITAALMASSASAAPAPTRVQTDAGYVTGVASAEAVAFKGIPYAAAPVGALRWRPPQPAARWSGDRAATAYGADCMQKPYTGSNGTIATTPAEDCLFVNVWRPAQTSDKPLPVLVWIHGGGFVNGGSSLGIYSGEAFARDGVILVSLNYRLGRFGFFGHPALTQEHPDEPKANYGYLDQIAALKWVQRNIAAFGGDPKNVTVFGQSAGGGSVHALLTSPLAKGLFERAVIHSGGGRGGLTGGWKLSQAVGDTPSLEQIGVNFAQTKGIADTGPAGLVKLRALTADEVVDGLQIIARPDKDGPPTFGGPTIDGKVVLEHPDAAYRAGHNAKVPVMIGATDADIGSELSTFDRADPFKGFGAGRAAAKAAYDPDNSGDAAEIGRKMGLDAVMLEPARSTARAFRVQGLPAYEFRFSYVAPSIAAQNPKGARHSSDLPFVFDTVDVRYGDKLTATDQQVATTAHGYWVNFAKTGDPNGPGLPRWPTAEANRDQVLDFRRDGVVAAGPDPWRARLDATAALARP